MNKENDILKWFNGELSTEEIKKLYPNEDLTALEKSRFYSRQLEAPKVDAQKALADFRKRNSKKEDTKVIPLNFKSFLKIAAVLVLMLSASYFLFFNNEKSFATEIAQTEILNLPDNSEVILNAKSNLSFNKKSWKKNRLLELDGEAFFKVSKGEQFTVKTDAGDVKVLGTQFNVKERDNYFEVKCYEGLVSVTHKEKVKMINPGETFRVVNGTIVNVEKFNTKNPAWLSKESSFDKVPLWQVIDELEIQYDINISAEDIETTTMFSGSFTHTDKNIALQSVTIPLNLSYKINGNQVELYSYGSQ
ncbi:FecR family protein [Winogradskyella ursingii]|uniref:FecR family protein n=1 Tax=Winogradskyella ursingii TaxID=2686079 RepID=UPI0015CA3C43|nr:FecR family protein [Winogradskyella ursingii]